MSYYHKNSFVFCQLLFDAWQIMVSRPTGGPWATCWETSAILIWCCLVLQRPGGNSSQVRVKPSRPQAHHSDTLKQHWTKSSLRILHLKNYLHTFKPSYKLNYLWDGLLDQRFLPSTSTCWWKVVSGGAVNLLPKPAMNSLLWPHHRTAVSGVYRADSVTTDTGALFSSS